MAHLSPGASSRASSSGLPKVQVHLIAAGKLAGEAANRKSAITLLMACLAEFACTAIFIFVSTGAATSSCHTIDIAERNGANNTLDNVAPGACSLASTNLFVIATAFGFSIFIMVYAAANFSGGHLNPAVTVALLLAGRISLLRATTYILMQMSGACLGSLLVKAVDPSGFTAALGGTNRLSSWATPGQAVAAEIILTAMLVFVVFAATDTLRAQSAAHLPVLAPLAIGMTVFVANIVAIPIDGCSINPARTFGPAVVARHWDHPWVFWVGPLSGAAVAGLAYEWLAVRLTQQYETMPLAAATMQHHNLYAPGGAVAAHCVEEGCESSKPA